MKLSWKQADFLPFSSRNHGSSEAGNFVCQLFPRFFGEQMCNRFFNRRCFFPIEVAAKSCVFLVVPSRSFGKAETQIVFSDPQDMPAPKRGVGLSFLPGMGDQHQVHVWENTYIMQPKAFHQNSVADAC